MMIKINVLLLRKNILLCIKLPDRGRRTRPHSRQGPRSLRSTRRPPPRTRAPNSQLLPAETNITNTHMDTIEYIIV